MPAVRTVSLLLAASHRVDVRRREPTQDREVVSAIVGGVGPRKGGT